MTPWDLSRRVFLRGAGLAAVGIGFQPSSLLVRAAEAAGAGPRVLVQVFLRGGATASTSACPTATPTTTTLRGGIALLAQRGPGPGRLLRAAPRAGPDPARSSDDGRLAFVHAAGQLRADPLALRRPGLHGDGHAGRQVHDRRLARAVDRRRSRASEVTQAVAFAAQLPRSFLGSEPVLVAQNLASFDLRARNWRSEAETLLRAMYDGSESAIARTGQETFAAMSVLLRTPEIQAPPANGAVYPAGNMGTSLRQAAQLIKAGLGTRCIFVNVPGRLRHAREPARRRTRSSSGASAQPWPPSTRTWARAWTTWWSW